MSWISQHLGLDNHPTLLAALNRVGQEIGTEALAAVPESDLKGKISAAVDAGAARLVGVIPGIPPEIAGLAKILIADEIKPFLFAELDKFEHTLLPPSPPPVLPPPPPVLPPPPPLDNSADSAGFFAQ